MSKSHRAKAICSLKNLQVPTNTKLHSKLHCYLLIISMKKPLQNVKADKILTT